MKYDFKKTGERVRNLRNQNKWSQEDFIEKLNCRDLRIGRNTLSHIENGAVTPSLKFLLTSCEVFGCDVGYLLCEYDCKTRTIDDIHQVTGLSEKAIHAICHCGEKEFADGYYDITRGVEKAILNLLLESIAFHEIMHQLCFCYAAFGTTGSIDSQLTGADVLKMEEIATATGCVILENQQAAEFYASAAADRLKQFALAQIKKHSNSKLVTKEV